MSCYIAITMCFASRPSWDELKIHQNPLPELIFFDTKNRFCYQKRPQVDLKTYERIILPLGTPLGPPRVPGPEIDDSEVDFGADFGPRA